MKAEWNGVILAESDDTVEVEGNQYFPPDSLRHEYLTPSPKSSWCPWKGTASYYDVSVAGEVNAGAAWTYPDPKPRAAEVRDRVAFWKGVKVSR